MASSQFEYMICLDFEATCWEESDPQSAEIIGNVHYVQQFYFVQCVFVKSRGETTAELFEQTDGIFETNFW